MLNSTKLCIILIACVLGLGISTSVLAQDNNECDKIREECNKIRNECRELETKNGEAYDACQEIMKKMPQTDWDYNWSEEKKREMRIILDRAAEISKEYNKCNEDRLNTWGPLIRDCWKKYNECFARYQVCLDENIQPEDLGVKEPKLLPDSPFYFLKNWARGIQSFFTFDPIKKVELRMKIANEKLMETKNIVQKTKDPEIIKKAAENYQQEIEKIKEQVEKIKEKAAENPKVESFLDKFIHQQTLHQKLLQKLENQVPAQAFEKIKEAREAHLENFQGVMLKLEDREEKITEKLDKILEEQKGSQFKEFKNLEVLKNLEEKVPEEAKEAIQRAEENALKRLKGDLEKMNPEDQERFKEYIIRPTSAEQGTTIELSFEILENLKAKTKEVPETPQLLKLKETLEEGKVKVLEKIEERSEKLNCPLWTPPAPGFCQEGRVIVEKDEKGCPLPPRCIMLGEEELPPETLLPIKPIEPVKPSTKPTLVRPNGSRTEPTACIQVITPATGPDNVCKEFPTPCDVPKGWKKIDKCPSVSAPSTPPKPPISSEPTEIRYYTCPDGTKVESGKCYGKGETLRCTISVSPEKQCPLITPPVTRGTECPTQGETKYYQCSDGTQIPWCLCLQEGNFAGAKNKWQCQSYPIGFICPKPVVKVGPEKYPAGICAPGEKINYKCADGTSFKWCVCDDLGWDCPMYKYAERLCPATKEIILETGQRAPATCVLGEALNYKCPDGRTFRTCICEELGSTGTTAWECGLEPICSKPGPPVVTSVSISGAVTSDLPVELLQRTPFGTVSIFWMASEPVTSRLEYGQTTSYGFTAGPDYMGSTYQGVTLSDLQPNITYHFRIRARDKDITPNTIVSDDYTFILRKLPDLAIFPISVDHFNADTPNKIHVNIQNNGVATASKGFVVKVYVDDILAGEGAYDSDLAAGASGEKVFDYTFPGAKSYAIIKAAVDATNLVTELNEKNNEMRHTISIYSPTTGQPVEPVKPSQ